MRVLERDASRNSSRLRSAATPDTTICGPRDASLKRQLGTYFCAPGFLGGKVHFNSADESGGLLWLRPCAAW